MFEYGLAIRHTGRCNVGEQIRSAQRACIEDLECIFADLGGTGQRIEPAPVKVSGVVDGAEEGAPLIARVADCGTLPTFTLVTDGIRPQKSPPPVAGLSPQLGVSAATELALK